MQRTLVIVNSRSAQGRTGRLLSEIREWFRDSADVAETMSSGHAEVLAFEAIRNGNSFDLSASLFLAVFDHTLTTPRLWQHGESQTEKKQRQKEDKSRVRMRRPMPNRTAE